MANIYYQASALRDLGRVDWTCHGSSPTSMVYANDGDRTRTFIAWNPTAKPQTVQFFEGTKPLAQTRSRAAQHRKDDGQRTMKSGSTRRVPSYR